MVCLEVKKRAIGRTNVLGWNLSSGKFEDKIAHFRTRYTPILNDCEVSGINLKDFDSFDIEIDV